MIIEAKLIDGSSVILVEYDHEGYASYVTADGEFSSCHTRDVIVKISNRLAELPAEFPKYTRRTRKEVALLLKNRRKLRTTYDLFTTVGWYDFRTLKDLFIFVKHNNSEVNSMYSTRKGRSHCIIRPRGLACKKGSHVSAKTLRKHIPNLR